MATPVINGQAYIYSNPNGAVFDVNKKTGFVVVQQQSGKPLFEEWVDNYGFEYTGSGVPQL